MTANGVTSEQRRFESGFLLEPVFHELFDSIEAEVFVYEPNPRFQSCGSSSAASGGEPQPVRGYSPPHSALGGTRNPTTEGKGYGGREALYQQLAEGRKQKLPLPDFPKTTNYK
ncbi:MAG: hypothetical protein H6573_36080 [Lewinellaceae bacterium]|nr:hypothetical protein [Lewinellaceae bacterium]